jgi:haloacetate dehalogenase
VFDGFTHFQIDTAGARINLRYGGSGPPLLLLHGNPLTHVMWHKIAPRLAEEFTVVATDLRGYGDSAKPDGGAGHSGYSFRAMAKDQVEVMEALGFAAFDVCGHDRGGRVAHRMALDYPQRVKKVAFLDIVPTHHLLNNIKKTWAVDSYHWFFMAQPYDYPEQMLIAYGLERYIRKKLKKGVGASGAGEAQARRARRSANDAANTLASDSARQDEEAALSAFTPEALAEYIRCCTPENIHAVCEDYRAAVGIDLIHDEADLHVKLTIPMLVLWGEHSHVERSYKPIEAWRERALDVRGKMLPCGHYPAEQAPDETYAELRAFLSR